MDTRTARATALLALLVPLSALAGCRRDAGDRMDRAGDHLERAGEHIEEAGRETGRAIDEEVEDRRR